MGFSSLGKPAFFDVFRVMAVPLMILVSLDLSTTYIGTCILNGFEVNPLAVMMSKYVGFWGLIIFQYVQYIIGAAVLAFWYVHARGKPPMVRYEIIATLALVIYGVMLYSYVGLLVVNYNSLLLAAGIDLHIPIQAILSMSTQELLHAQTEFVSVREAFCRLVP